MRATPDEYPSVEEVLGTPVLESGSLGLAEGGGVSEEIGLFFSNFTPGERSGLQKMGPVREDSTPWMTEGSCCRETKATAASLH